MTLSGKVSQFCKYAAISLVLPVALYAGAKALNRDKRVDAEIQQMHTHEYTIRRGDRLWDEAYRFIGRREHYPVFGIIDRTIELNSGIMDDKGHYHPGSTARLLCNQPHRAAGLR